MSDAVAAQLDVWRLQVEAALDQALAAEGSREPQLLAAMRCATQAGGKRLRPLLVLAACDACGGRADEALAAAVAIELIHTYSLVHDDLPAMDDAQLRRGQPCVHVVYGEALGILAGDALHTLAFEVLSQGRLSAPQIVRQVHALAQAAGVGGMAGGQTLDLAAEGASFVDEAQVAQIHRLKTGALLRCSLLLGAVSAGASPTVESRLVEAGERIGLAFQIQDDILDVTADSAVLGKTAGQDEAKGKATWPAVVGLEESRHRVARLTSEALAILTALPAAAAPLRWLVQRAANRAS